MEERLLDWDSSKACSALRFCSATSSSRRWIASCSLCALVRNTGFFMLVALSGSSIDERFMVVVDWIGFSVY